MINVLIIDDHEVVVKGFKIIFEESFENITISSSSSFPDGLSLIKIHDYDLVILDIDVPGGGSTKMISRIREHKPFIKILICSGLGERENCLNYLRAGANGYIHKSAATDTYVSAVGLILANKTFISDEMRQEVLDLALKRQQIKKSNIIESLTDREYEIARKIVDGKYTKEIASEMNLKENTISTFKKKILTKLGVKNAIDLSHIFSKENT